MKAIVVSYFIKLWEAFVIYEVLAKPYTTALQKTNMQWKRYKRIYENTGQHQNEADMVDIHVYQSYVHLRDRAMDKYENYRMEQEISRYNMYYGVCDRRMDRWHNVRKTMEQQMSIVRYEHTYTILLRYMPRVLANIIADYDPHLYFGCLCNY